VSPDLAAIRSVLSRATGTGWEAAYRQDVGALLGAVAQAERERDELALTLANERGEGAGPSEGWEYDFAWDGDTPINFGWHNGDAYVENGTRYDEGGWRLSIAGKPLGKHPTARAAMLAADAALIANAPTDLRYLLDLVATLRGPR